MDYKQQEKFVLYFTRPRDQDIRLVYYLSTYFHFHLYPIISPNLWCMLTFKLFWYPNQIYVINCIKNYEWQAISTH